MQLSVWYMVPWWTGHMQGGWEGQIRLVCIHGADVAVLCGALCPLQLVHLRP